MPSVAPPRTLTVVTAMPDDRDVDLLTPHLEGIPEDDDVEPADANTSHDGRPDEGWT